MQLIVQPITSPNSRTEFPEILPFISSGQKGILHCYTMDQVHCILMYLISAHKGDVNPLCHFCPYFSMCPDEYNERTLFLLDNDPYCQIVIATVAFTNVINSKHLLDSLFLLPANTLDLILQEKGCGG